MNDNPIEAVNLEQKLSLFQDQWSPKVIAALNGQWVKLAKVQGEFVWHSHEHEDELFLVVSGELTLRFRDREVNLREGELCVVPRGVEHQPYAEQEAHILLFEPATTAHTGSEITDRTVATDDQSWI